MGRLKEIQDRKERDFPVTPRSHRSEQLQRRSHLLRQCGILLFVNRQAVQLLMQSVDHNERVLPEVVHQNIPQTVAQWRPLKIAGHGLSSVWHGAEAWQD